MKKRPNNFARASTLRITVALALMSISAILLASILKAAPTAPQNGFYPPLPDQGVTPTPTPCVIFFSENFDGETAPALPAGWTTAATGVEVPWVTSTSNPASAPNDAFAPDVTNVGNTELITPTIAAPAGGGVLTFRNLFNMEFADATTGYDGMVLEISIAGGAYADILAAGGSFVTGGYTRTISSGFMSPIAGRMAWSGISGGTTTAPTYITTTVNLPAAASGQNIQLKWRAASDNSVAAAGDSGVRVDNIVITSAGCPSPTPSPTGTPSPSPGACGWVAAPVIPIPILDEPVTTVGSNMYTFSGVSNGAITTTSYKFDGTTWTTIAPLPVALEFAAAVTDGTNIYVMGGSNINGVPQTTLYRYNVAVDTYTTLAPFTTGTWSHAAVYLDGKIYKFAGTGPGTASTNMLEIYDVASNTWTTGAPYPLSVSFVSAFTQGGFIYGAGGIVSATSNASAKTYRYTPGTNTWDDAGIADLPATRWGAASSFYNGGGVLAGGYVAGAATANISNTAVSWNAATDTWSSLPNMLGERARMNGAVLSGSFYVVGGRSIASSGFVGTNDNQKLACAAQPLNLSTRMLVQTGAEVGIGGFIVTGTAPKRVILRAIGPSLTITGKLADPVMELHGPAGFATIINDNWRDAQEAEIIATGIPPTNDLESAIVANLAPGPYTAIVSGKNGTSGVALVEAYDLDQAAASKLGNISTRAFVSTGANIMIAGFILGNGSGMDNVILRGIGPSLPVTNKLADPTLELRDSNGTLVRSDDNWQDDPAQAALISAAGLAPGDPLESGVAATLAPGPYTALLAGLNNGTGVGLVEVYDLGGTP